MRIVFMGTPDFATKTLQALINSDNEIVGVFCQPDKKKGRGHHVQFPPVKELAVENNIEVFQPASLRNSESFDMVKNLKPDLLVVVAYGKMLPVDLLNIPEYGCVNVHGSLLPKYRGAAPIQWSVLNGDKYAGVTTQFMAEGCDTGNMLLSSKTEIMPNETSSELYERLSIMGADVLMETLSKLKSNTLNPIAQDENLASHAPMLSKEMSDIDFSKPALKVHNQICGLSEWPCASTTINEKRLKIYKSEVVTDFLETNIKEILSKKDFVIGCGENTAIKLVEVQYEGSKRMNGGDFMRGQRLVKGVKI